MLKSTTLAVVAAASMMGAGLTGTVVASSPAAAESATASDGQYAPDAATARSLAAELHRPVAVDSLTTPQERTSALPNGSYQYEASSVPVRVKKGAVWTAVDMRLVHSGGWLEPAASVAQVKFSAGGSDVLDEVRTPSGKWITDVWPYGVLPAPAIDENSATYANVLPGVDLRLTATETGMSTVYVVKSAEAAFGAKLKDLHLKLSGAKVSKGENGTLVADTGDGSSVKASAPLWWDSSNGGNSTAPGGDQPLRPVVSASTTDGESLDVGASLAAATVAYPVYVDPDWSSGQSASWYTDKAYPNTAYLASGAGYVLRVGIYGTYQSDMFFQFPIGALGGKVIQSAQLATTQTSIDACSTNPIDVATFGPQNPGFTWNQEQSWTNQWGPTLDSQNPGSCSTPNASVPVGWNVLGGIQSKLGQPSVQFGVRSHSSAQSRRHFASTATLTVVYDTAPNTATNAHFVSPAVACSTDAAAPVAFNGNQTVTVSVNQTDPDPGNVADDFSVQDYTTSTQVAHGVTALAPQGTQSWSFAASGLVAGHLYGWSARGSDYVVEAASASPTCYFTIDNSLPDGP